MTFVFHEQSEKGQCWAPILYDTKQCKSHGRNTQTRNARNSAFWMVLLLGEYLGQSSLNSGVQPTFCNWTQLNPLTSWGARCYRKNHHLGQCYSLQAFHHMVKWKDPYKTDIPTRATWFQPLLMTEVEKSLPAAAASAPALNTTVSGLLRCHTAIFIFPLSLLETSAFQPGPEVGDIVRWWWRSERGVSCRISPLPPELLRFVLSNFAGHLLRPL